MQVKKLLLKLIMLGLLLVITMAFHQPVRANPSCRTNGVCFSQDLKMRGLCENANCVCRLSNGTRFSSEYCQSILP
jgi:hypothetical protein